MAGNKQQQNQKKFSIFSIFKSRRPRRSGDHHDNYNYAVEDSGRKIWPSDEDKGGRFAEPGIDKKASAFIARFHETRVFESEHHAVYQAKV